MVGSFDDDLVGANAIHLVKHALGLLVQASFYAKRRELVGNDAHRPTWSVLHGSAAIGARPIGQNFRWSFIFVAVAEGAKPSPDLDRFAREVGRTLGAIRGNNHPSAHDGVFSQFRHVLTFPSIGVIKSRS